MYSIYSRAEQNHRFDTDPNDPIYATTEALDEYQRLYRAALSPDTLRHLDQCQKQFKVWCVAEGVPAEPPISPLEVARYVEFLGGTVSLQTIKNRVWAIGELHRSRFLPSPSKHRIVVLAIRATQRKYGSRVKQAPPLCKAEVIGICNKLGSTLHELRDKALMLTASDSWCRASELVALKVNDIERQADGSATVNLLNSKYDPYGRGEHAYLSPHTFLAVKKLIETTGKKADDYLFTALGGSKPGGQIVPTTVSRIFKKRVGRADVSAHSTRIGGVHDALRLGCDLVQIMTSGRWASPEMPAVYGRKLMASKSAAADVCRAYEDLYQ